MEFHGGITTKIEGEFAVARHARAGHLWQFVNMPASEESLRRAIAASSEDSAPKSIATALVKRVL